MRKIRITLLIFITLFWRDKKIIISGHSYGAPIAMVFATKYPVVIVGLIVSAGSFIPELGKPRQYNRPTSFSVLSWLLKDEISNAISHLHF